MPKKAAKVLITRRAAIQRINRKLASEHRQVRAYRSGLRYGAAARSWNDLGEYFVLDLDRNVILRGHVNLEELGRELGIIAAYEAVEEG